MASTYLSRTNGTPTGTNKYTFSFWWKRCGLASRQHMIRVINPASTAAYSYIETDGDNLAVIDYDGTNNYYRNTTQLFRDTSAWYHIVVTFDTTLATANDRVKIYVNGSQVTSLATVTNGIINQTLIANSSGRNVYVGAGENTRFSDCLMAHVHFTDGTAYDASAFGETDATTGIWKPKTAPSVTYGTNGFFLKFENPASLGLDSSGNANNFTVNGTPTQTVDTPSNVFATLNPLAGTAIGSYTNGNNRVVGVATSWTTAPSTLAVSSGKFYCEAKAQSTSLMVGILDIDQMVTNNFQGTKSNGWGYEVTGTLWNNGGATASWGATYTTGDIIGIAMDLDNNKLYFSKNGTWQNSADPSAGTGGISITADKTYYFAMSPVDSTSSVIETNFGNGYFGTTAVSSAQNPDDGIGIFEYDVPAGYKAICTKSINAQEYD